MPYIVFVLLIELVICHLAERLAPKYERLLDWQTEDLDRLPRQPRFDPSKFVTYLEEEAVFQPAKIRQMLSFP